jgi:hypothetical protein
MSQPQPLVAVLYSDIRCDQTEMFTPEEVGTRTGVEFVVFGLLVRNDAEYLAVAQERCENGNFRGVTTIHRALVRSVVPICQWPKSARRPRERTARTPPILRAPAADGADA